jgi:drug/metabolite transporter, DME family
MPIGPLLIFIAAILWGIDGILRRSLYVLPPITIVFYEHVIGAIILLPFFLRVFKKEHLTKREWWAMAIVALGSGLLGTLFFTSALAAVNFIPFSVVYLLQKLQPIFAVGTAALVLKERPSRRYWAWAAVALAAAYFVTFPGGQIATTPSALSAALFALLAALCWGADTAISRYTLLSHSSVFITGVRFLLTIIFAIPFLFLLHAAPALPVLSGDQILRFAGIAVTSGMFALWLYYRGLKTTPASVSTIVELAFPLTAVLIDYFLYETTLAVSQYIAAVVLLFAVYVVSRLNKPMAKNVVA